MVIIAEGTCLRTVFTSEVTFPNLPRSVGVNLWWSDLGHALTWPDRQARHESCRKTLVFTFSQALAYGLGTNFLNIIIIQPLVTSHAPNCEYALSYSTFFLIHSESEGTMASPVPDDISHLRSEVEVRLYIYTISWAALISPSDCEVNRRTPRPRMRPLSSLSRLRNYLCAHLSWPKILTLGNL